MKIKKRQVFDENKTIEDIDIDIRAELKKQAFDELNIALKHMIAAHNMTLAICDPLEFAVRQKNLLDHTVRYLIKKAEYDNALLL